ncbi:MAG: PTS sugar transporter subunit IIC [Erysipelotrichaceae bacterium]|nr:PTS sugar transporter subunit IIC [Erysipelotrichaceae bacterium]
MQITLFQGLMLAILAFIVAWDKRWESFFAFRPIIVGTCVGIILGDLNTGLYAGAITELSYLGLTTVGGTVPPDPLMAGIMTTVIAIRSGVSPEAALGLSLPFALLMQWYTIAEQSIASLINSKLEGALNANNIKKFSKLVFVPDLFMTLGYAVVTFLSVYVMQDAITAFVNGFPIWLTHGFEIAGGVLPAVGLGNLLTIMINKDNWPFIIFGFVAMTVLSLSNVLPIALVAVGLIFLIYKRDISQDKIAEAITNIGNGGGEDDGI